MVSPSTLLTESRNSSEGLTKLRYDFTVESYYGRDYAFGPDKGLPRLGATHGIAYSCFKRESTCT